MSEIAEPIDTPDLQNLLGEPFESMVKTLALKSQPAYRKRALEFIEFCRKTGRDCNDCRNLGQYLSHLRTDEEFEYSASTLWTVCSMISSWYLATHKISVKDADPMLYRMLKQWDKQDERKKASTFTKEDINKFLSEFDDANGGLTMKVGLIVSIYGLLRCCELVQVQFSDLSFNADHIRMSVYRRKQTGEKKQFQYFITDDESRALLSQYVNLFPKKVSFSS